MAKQLQFRRGTTAENDAFKGAPGELTYDIERKELRIHDGVTTGGKTVEPSTNVVHTIGNETVAGIKTFTSPTRKTTTLERGVIPSANTNVPATQFMDKNSKVLGELEYFYGTNGKNGMTLLLYDSSGNRGAGLRIGQNSDGTTYASAPTPASTSNSTDLATTAWVNNAAVHKTGNETIDGTKTFYHLRLRDDIPNSKDITTATETTLMETTLNAAGGIDGASIIRYVFSTGEREVRYRAGFSKRNSSGNLWPGIRVGTDANDNTYYRIDQSPAASSNGIDIATTAWVRDLFETLYPVGSLYITSSNTTTCPLASIVKKSDGTDSTWSLVSSGKALWTGTGSNGNTTIAAGLPNITGNVNGVSNENFYSTPTADGAFYVDNYANNAFSGGNGIANNSALLHLDASRSSSVYGKSTTVQPPAYVANVWRRTA